MVTKYQMFVAGCSNDLTQSSSHTHLLSRIFTAGVSTLSLSGPTEHLKYYSLQACMTTRRGKWKLASGSSMNVPSMNVPSMNNNYVASGHVVPSVNVPQLSCTHNIPSSKPLNRGVGYASRSDWMAGHYLICLLHSD